MLGEEQWAWLEQQLAAPAVDVQLYLVGAGLQMLPDDRAIGETWGRFPRARARLMDLVSRAAAPAVLLSGDVHYSEITDVRCRANSTGGVKDIAEVTASGMTHSWGEPKGFMGHNVFNKLGDVGAAISYFVNDILNPRGFELTQRVLGCAYRRDNLEDYTAERGFGVVDIEWGEAGTPPRVTTKIVGKDGATLLERDLSYSNAATEGSSAGSDSFDCGPLHEVSDLQRVLQKVVAIGIILLVFGSMLHVLLFVLTLPWTLLRLWTRRKITPKEKKQQ
uniref:PhoD-like phosphatase metallophosphatase domain-containing protein n=2 Tax=Phaeomonas parva TaxID=124430 RepID=A0A7S1XL37_9STRA|mmetsp:Transcript_12758/g.38279  ORF Transcript_12758/g.38279 Transcript_12758/m.38279 type:complete len:277 (+) Transcript_12758:699-1529(+)